MKIMHLGDLHIGKSVNGFSMIEDQIHVLNQVKNYIRDYKPDVLVIAGDIYDRPQAPAAAVSLFSEFIAEVALDLKTPIMGVAGNHDGADLISYGSELLEKMNVHLEGRLNSVIKKVTLTDEFGPVNFYLLPFADYAVVRDVLNDKEVKSLHSATAAMLKHNPIDDTERNVLVTHAFVRGDADVEQSESEKSLVVGGKEEVGLSLFEAFDYVALGHLHGSQYVGKKHVRYSGTLLKYSFSEEYHKKSVTFIELNKKGDVHCELLDIKPLRNLRSIEGPLQTLLDNADPLTKHDFLRVVLTDDGELIEPMAKLRAVYPNVMLLEFKNKMRDFTGATLSKEARLSKSPIELFADFYEGAKGEPLTDNRKAIVEEALQSLMGGEIE
ncbi:MAG TPA: exonuclease SbcCD subunit D [Firmicutes bacterium]|nr:exonuclease SbcCD subunit D [Bacillota bacterium]